MYVYLVEYGYTDFCVENESVEGVFDSEEKAMDCIPNTFEEDKKTNYGKNVRVFQCFDEYRGLHSYSITKLELNKVY